MTILKTIDKKKFQRRGLAFALAFAFLSFVAISNISAQPAPVPGTPEYANQQIKKPRRPTRLQDKVGIVKEPVAPRPPQPPKRSVRRAAPRRAAPSSTRSPIDTTRRSSIENQLNGRYPSMARVPGIPLGTIQRVWDRPSPSPGQRAPGIVWFDWTPNHVMAIRTRDYMITTLHFPQYENIKTFYLGDPTIFEGQKIQTNMLVLRSKNPGADTNLTVIGVSGNVYNFYVRSEGWNTEHVTDLTVYITAKRGGRTGAGAKSNMLAIPQEYGASLAYSPAAPFGKPSPYANGTTFGGSSPHGSGYASSGGLGGGGGTLSGPAHAQSMNDGLGLYPPDYIRQIAFRPENLQFDMKMYAETIEDAEIAPERVFHDGVFTYLDFGDDADSVRRPVVHLIIDEIDTLVNTRSAGPTNNVTVVEAVGDLTLRNGQKIVCIKRHAPLRRGGAIVMEEELQGISRRSSFPKTGSGVNVGTGTIRPEKEPRGQIKRIPKYNEGRVDRGSATRSQIPIDQHPY